ncbi:hypothetical protein GGTG_04529 [Gaeumannomyces tritici R3-111a-1]|uniref:Uncharacterized protein n=1 Tax=Gaeumannomyces tritici (strain R3-111a-1) TaxID=644352 RepID=J3NTD0_GAET3|nr:hypothetical protein GGTG_04529 [Gaeumannomyces tritici R3-111a-1]EJT79445.1 hypothetical protein GGTG_04529 [Gaeumannomyces tritici R3-111a-1]
MLQDIILGRKFFDYHDILADCRNRQLLFTETSLPMEKTADIPMDESAQPTPGKPEWEKDVADRKKAMALEDKRRADGEPHR